MDAGSGFRAARERMETMSTSLPNALGVYVSIPFCRSKCTFCNFASGVYPASSHARYIDRVTEDLAAAGVWAEKMGVELPRTVDSIYLGGGTPSVLAPELVERLFTALRGAFEVAPDAEITAECAPAQLSDETLAALLHSGVNRVSLGVQSFVDHELKIGGRLHTRVTALETIARLRMAGIENLSIDLIAGLAGQTESSWEESLEALLALGVPHASIYMLEVDEDSRLGRELLAGGARYHAAEVPADEAITQMYSRGIARLAGNGLQQYEISNFARPGRESRHNLLYWQRRPYLGLGLDASSMLLAERVGSEDSSSEQYVLRSTTTAGLTAYLNATEPPETAWLSPDRQHEEAWFLGLRRNAGVEIAAIEKEFGEMRVKRARNALKRLEGTGLMECDGHTARLTAQGRLFSNDVFQEFLEQAKDEEE
jgi:oxygen-independent coproporphyrinogen-3 oxidase